MNIEIIKALKERAKEMLEDNYNRKIGDEEIYTIICELENFYTAYEKEKEKNKKLISQIDEHVYNGCDYELCNKKWVKKIKALMEKEDKLFFETKDVRHANRYKAYKELIKEE